ncbi:hypothetical protein [Haloarcula sp. Atlit-120R]|nr:hypothetical protein [Haloarcula sp. Atlit-120R]
MRRKRLLQVIAGTALVGLGVVGRDGQITNAELQTAIDGLELLAKAAGA